eukprot:COSAG05_NODE_1018_length_6171_cov_6.038867_2_plen_774_part_00
MGAVDGIIQLALYACFGIYIAMGFGLVGLGAFYMYDAGSVGSTATYLVLLGLCMLFIGSVAVFANLRQIWLVLLIVECINVALFLGLYLLTVVVLLQASGTTDPVRRTTEENWDRILRTLTLPDSDGENTSPPGAFCETQVTEPAYAATCSGTNGWYAVMEGAPYNTNPCHIGYSVPGYKTPEEVTNNCTILQEGWTVSGVDNQVGCSALYATCAACVIGCKEQTITNVKDNLVPATYFAFLTAAFMAGTVVWNNIMMSGGEISTTQQLPGLAVNGSLAGAGFIMLLVAAWGAYQASESCPELAEDCMPMSITLTLVGGVATSCVAGVALFGVKKENILALQIATVCMAVFTLVLILVACVLGVSSGTMMEDTGYYYDANYPKLRKAVETVDSEYCTMTDADCKDLTVNGASICPKDEDGVCILADDVAVQPMTRDDIWMQQHSTLSFLAQQPAELLAQPWLAPCETTGICISCNTFYERSGFQQSSVGTFANYTDFLGGSDTFNLLGEIGGTGTIANQKNILAKLPTTGSQWIPMPAADWTAVISNYTWHDSLSHDAMGHCESEIIAYSESDETCNELLEDENNNAAVILSNPPVLQINSYQRNCRSCESNIDFPFVFNVENPFADAPGTEQTECLNFFVGHMINECGFGTSATGTDHSTCQDEIYGGGIVGPGTAGLHVDYLIAKAKKFVMSDLSEKKLPFCSYSDAGCKSKLKNTLENSMETIGYFSLLFLFFFVFIIYFTYRAIIAYRSGDGSLLPTGGDDDDDDGAEE